MLQNYNMWITAGIFFDEPTKSHYLLEISRKTKIAHTSVKKYLNDLKRMSLINEHIEKRRSRKFPYYKANINNNNYKNYKIHYNLIKLRESGLINYLKDTLMPKSIILFGSYRKGEDIEDSDIDIFLECKTESVNIKKFELKLKRKIELHFKENFKDYPTELKNNIINGVVLEGFLEAF